MACESIAARLADLQDQQKQLQEVMANLKGVGLVAAQEQLADVTTDIATEQKNLADCKAIAAQEGHPTQRPFIAQVKDIYCGAASRELGNDEPYLLIASVLMNSPVVAGLPVAKPAVHCFKVGPWGGVDPGSTHLASKLAASNRPKFWDLSGQPALVNSPQDVMFLVSLVEHDGSSPAAIREALETALELSIATNLGLSYSELVRTLASDMAGAIDSSALLGLSPAHLNRDDRVDGALQLSLTKDDLTAINALGKREKTLTFKRKNASHNVTDRYTVTFSLEA